MILESLADILWDPDGAALHLVAIGDPMWEPMAIPRAGQAVQAVRPIRSAGAIHYPRGHEQHRLSYALVGEHSGPGPAQSARLQKQIDLPRGRADVLIRLSGGDQYRLKNASVVSWPGEDVEHLSLHRVEITGGEIVEDAGDYVPPLTAL